VIDGEKRFPRRPSNTFNCGAAPDATAHDQNEPMSNEPNVRPSFLIVNEPSSLIFGHFSDET
jgi:hypothetical protein